VFVSSPDDWVRRAPGAPILHCPSCHPSASSGTSSRTEAEARHYWTTRVQEALADDDSRSSSQSSRPEPLRENRSTWSQDRPDSLPTTKTAPSASPSGNAPGAGDDFAHHRDEEYEASSFFGNTTDSLGFAVWDDALAVDPANPELAVSQGVSDPDMSALFPRVTGTEVSPSRMLGFPGPPPFGHFCSLWMLSRDIPAAKQVYDKNVCNLACSGIDSPSMLLQRCIDMWLAVASATVEPQITQEALSVCLKVISGMSSDDRLSFAS
jgi:hypothetical protein